MKRFCFNLETLRNHRGIVEERERSKFAGLNFQLQREMQYLQSLREKHSVTLADLTRAETVKYDSAEILWFYAYLKRLAAEMEQSGERISRLKGRLEKQKALLVEASKNRKMIDNLRKRREREYLVAEERNEQKSIDEIVVTQFAHKK